MVLGLGDADNDTALAIMSTADAPEGSLWLNDTKFGIGSSTGPYQLWQVFCELVSDAPSMQCCIDQAPNLTMFHLADWLLHSTDTDRQEFCQPAANS